MARASIPVDLFNPGQVFACLGFLEAADVLLGEAEGGFDWHDPEHVRFLMSAEGVRNPFEAALEFIVQADIVAIAPPGYVQEKGDVPECSEVFPSEEADPMRLPIRLSGATGTVSVLGHWADGSGRVDFKLYSGNRSALVIARAMVTGTGRGEGVKSLWERQREELVRDPFNLVVPMGGSFNLDPRGGWSAIDAGYSPNDSGHEVVSSPVVEILAAWGLENARPHCEDGRREYVYQVWQRAAPLTLSRAVLGGAPMTTGQRRFRFELALSGKNKFVTFSEEDAHDDKRN